MLAEIINRGEWWDGQQKIHGYYRRHMQVGLNNKLHDRSNFITDRDLMLRIQLDFKEFKSW